MTTPPQTGTDQRKVGGPDWTETYDEEDNQLLGDNEYMYTNGLYNTDLVYDNRPPHRPTQHTAHSPTYFRQSVDG